MTEFEIAHGLSQDAPGPLEPVEPVEVAKVPESMGTEWKTVPATMTLDMCVAFAEAWFSKVRCIDDPEMQDAYAAMIAAAPPAPTSHPIPTGATGEVQDNSGMSPYCPECDGGGRISVLSDNSPDAHDVDIDCTHCGGSGSAADAAKNLARALQSERMQHLQIYGEYKNFHRSLCARFGYGHDPVHFRRDLVSLEEAIAAKVSAPAAGDAQPNFDIEAAAQKLAECMDYPWAHMPEQGRTHMRKYAQAVIDAALAAIAQQQGGAA